MCTAIGFHLSCECTSSGSHTTQGLCSSPGHVVICRMSPMHAHDEIGVTSQGLFSFQGKLCVSLPALHRKCFPTVGRMGHSTKFSIPISDMTVDLMLGGVVYSNRAAVLDNGNTQLNGGFFIHLSFFTKQTAIPSFYMLTPGIICSNKSKRF